MTLESRKARVQGAYYMGYQLGRQNAGSVTQDAGGVTQDAGGVTQDVGGVTQDVGGVTHDVGGVTHDVGGVTQDVGGVTQDVGGVIQDAGCRWENTSTLRCPVFPLCAPPTTSPHPPTGVSLNVRDHATRQPWGGPLKRLRRLTKAWTTMGRPPWMGAQQK